MKKKIRGRIRRKKRGPVVSKKVTCDGIQFASGLEKYMYLALKEAKIVDRYEGETYIECGREGHYVEYRNKKGK